MVTLYSKPGCNPCRLTKRALDSKGIKYVAKDITEDPTALERVRELGYQTVPVIEAGDQHWNGYQPDRLASL